MLGCAVDPLVHRFGRRRSRSTASAVPPGTRASSAHGEQDAAQRAQLGLEQAVRVGEVDRFEGVAADELGQPIGLVRGGPDAPAASRTGSPGRRAPRAPRPPPSRRGRRRRRSRRRSRQRHLLGLGEHDLVPALEAGPGLALGLADLLLHADPAALGAGLRHRPVPGGEVAGRVAHAAPERLAPLGAPLGEIARRGTWDT